MVAARGRTEVPRMAGMARCFQGKGRSSGLKLGFSNLLAKRGDVEGTRKGPRRKRLRERHFDEEKGRKEERNQRKKFSLSTKSG